MMTTEAKTAFIAHMFNNADWANVGDAAGLQNSASAGSLYVSMHTAPLGEGDNQSTNEVSYTGYTRFAVARSGAGWTCSADVASNAAAVSFGTDTAGTPTAVWFGVGTASSGAGHLIGGNVLDSPLAIVVGLNPTFPIGALVAQILSA